MYMCTYVYMCVYIGIYMCVCVYIYIHFFMANKMVLIEIILFSIYNNPVMMGDDPSC